MKGNTIMKHISPFLGVLAALIAAGLAAEQGASLVLLVIFALASGYVTLVAADSYRKNRARIRRHITRLTKPTVAARRTRRKGARK